ncbi:hypothetical protein CFP56_023567 [Quercus suber]|uniref:Uncharacterized protein n=1 Tax=Quercus suber TaxID=58331 RepID=A0AAW0K9H4_QUESU
MWLRPKKLLVVNALEEPFNFQGRMLVGGCNNGGTNDLCPSLNKPLPLFKDPMNYKDSLGCNHNIAI